MIEFTDIRQGQVLLIEPYNFDDRGIAIKPGHRIRLSDEKGNSVVLDEAQLNSALRVLCKQRED